MLLYVDSVVFCARRLLRLMALALDLPAGFFSDKFADGMGTLTPIHYTPGVSKPGQMFGAGAHTDFGGFWVSKLICLLLLVMRLGRHATTLLQSARLAAARVRCSKGCRCSMADLQTLHCFPCCRHHDHPQDRQQPRPTGLLPRCISVPRGSLCIARVHSKAPPTTCILHHGQPEECLLRSWVGVRTPNVLVQASGWRCPSAATALW